MDAAGREASSRAVDPEFEWLPSKQPVGTAPGLLGTTSDVADQLGLRQSRIYSGAEHDAPVLARHVPTSTIFVPSHEGRSHCPDEFTASPDITAGAARRFSMSSWARHRVALTGVTACRDSDRPPESTSAGRPPA